MQNDIKKRAIHFFLGLILVLLSPWAMPHSGDTSLTEQVESMYVAYYGRPGDPAGVSYWVQRLEAEGGDLSSIIDAFGTSDEYIFGIGGLSSTDQVNQIYQQMFGRNADSGGLDFYLGKLEAGTATLASIALDIFNGVQGNDAVIVAQKVAMAHLFTDYVELRNFDYNSNVIESASALLSSLDGSDASEESAFVSLINLFDLDFRADCESLTSSFDRIQQVVFEGYNCTNSACHAGSTPAGQLDLSAPLAYDSLFRKLASANLNEDTQLVYPGEQAFSFLYTKLEAATLGTTLPSGGGLPMPVGTSALSADHLEAVRLWIRAGAPESQEVDGVAELLGCDIGTTPVANKIAPPDAPEKGKGVQFVSGPWTVAANSENEVCFATYYDLTQQSGALPDWAKVPCEGGALNRYDGECFAYNEQVLTQDPQSHHSIIDVYVGGTSPKDPSWGTWQCLNGPNKGMACDPERIGVPVTEGGADCGGELAVCATVPTKSTACFGWGPQNRRQNLISIGGSQVPVSVKPFGDGVYAVIPDKGVITWNSHGFNLSDESTTIEQYNNFTYAKPEERVYRSRGIFDSKDILVASVPPYQQKTYCSTYTLPRGARLTSLGSHAHKRGVLWQSWLPPQQRNCTVYNGCAPHDTTADYVSRVYNDPLVITYDPPLPYDSASAEDRTIKFCVTYDNGQEFPELLKLSSESVGSRCTGAAYCAGGSLAGEFCGSNDDMCGDGGVCDACVVKGGFTTEDEMFILLGDYYLVPVD